MVNYERWAWGIAQELQASLSTADAATLSAELRAMGRDAWLAWADENRKAAFDLLSRTPAARERLRAWSDPTLRRRLVLVAHRQARLAAALLSATNHLGPGGSYRAECVHAARLAEDILSEAEWQWPFEGSPPFVDWLMMS